jgi:hypothetical protein
MAMEQQQLGTDQADLEDNLLSDPYPSEEQSQEHCSRGPHRTIPNGQKKGGVFSVLITALRFYRLPPVPQNDPLPVTSQGFLMSRVLSRSTGLPQISKPLPLHYHDLQ